MKTTAHKNGSGLVVDRRGLLSGLEIFDMAKTRDAARSEIAPYRELRANPGVYEVGRALRVRLCNENAVLLRMAASGCSGQAALESFIVIFIVCIMLFGLLQAAVVFTGSDILHHAAARAARARAVGFNDWMAFKAMRVASIPTSGRMLEPAFQPLQNNSPFGVNPRPGAAWDIAFTANPGISQRAALERLRVPAYLDSDNHGRAAYVLNYEEWERGSFTESERASAFGTGTIRYRVEQDFPLKMPFSKFVFPFTRTDENGDGRITLSGESESGQHSELYLEP